MDSVIGNQRLRRVSTTSRVMSYEPAWADTSWTDRLPNVPSWARENALPAVIVAALIGISGTVLVLLAPASHLHASLQGIWIVLWSLTTLVALAGAYSSLISYLDTDPQIDLDILPEDERRILDPILETPGITQQEVVARSDFSDAKVSQMLKALRERGLVYRESHGRTYRLYPGAILTEPTTDS